MYQIYCTSLLIISALFISSNTCAQTENNSEKESVQINHYLRKVKTDTLVFPGDPLLPENFLIQFPDSLYNSTKIEIKKYIISNIRGIKGLLRSENKTFSKVRFQIKGHRRARKFRDQLLKSLKMSKKQLEKADIIDVNGQKVNFRYDQSGRYHYFLFYLKEG